MSPASYQTAPPRVAMESGKRDSNPRPQPWQGCALPTELFPRAVGQSNRSVGFFVPPPPPPLTAPVPPVPPLPAPAKKRGRRRGLLSGLGTHEHERDILDQYLHEVSKTPLLTQKEEIALARKVRAGDQESMQELVKRNLRFVISVAKKYQNRGLPLTDLIGEGNVGLLTAARKFDPDQGVKFISYAVWWIRQAILAALARQGRTVRVPLNRTADLSRIVRSAEFLRQTLRRDRKSTRLNSSHTVI